MTTPAHPAHERIGLWLIGARGSVATTTAVGLSALRLGAAPSTGLVAELPEVARAGLAGYDQLVLGGHDTADEPLLKRAERLAEDGVVPAPLVALVRGELEQIDARIRPGHAADQSTEGQSVENGSPESQADALRRLTDDLRAFAADERLDRVVVIDVASTEPPASADLLAPDGPAADPERLRAALERGDVRLPASALYAWAAIEAGCAYVSFTPSTGARLPALARAAEAAGVPWAGSDGKTGETLLKSALAPMFAQRALQVTSWASYNMLGGGDGATLADPSAASSKTSSKRRGLEQMLGHEVEGPLHIDYVADLGQWKTAMNHVGFAGFLGTRMTLQFTWSGCDSSLAAPLVLDLARLVARAHQRGRSGPQPALGFFFKDPVGSDEHALGAQWSALTAWCAELGEQPA